MIKPLALSEARYLNRMVFMPSVAKLKHGDPFEGECFPDIAWYNTAFCDRFGKRGGDLEKWIHQSLCSEFERHMIEANKPFPDYAATIYQRHYFDFVRHTRYAWCWFESERESAAMWTSYGNQGVAIRSSAACLRSMLSKSSYSFVYRRMLYVDLRGDLHLGFDPEQEVHSDLLLRPFFHKRIEYASEQEDRFVTAGPEEENCFVVVCSEYQ